MAMPAPRRMIVLTDGYRDPHTAKTAICVIRYRPEEVVAVLDRQGAGQTASQWLGVGGAIPVVAAVADAPAANALLVGIAPPGGKLPPHWRAILLEAVGRRLTVISGMHEFLCDDAELVRAAAGTGAATGRSPPQRRAQRGRPPGPSRRLPAHPHRRQRLQLRQDGHGRRDRPRAGTRRRRCRFRGHRARPASWWPAAAARSIA